MIEAQVNMFDLAVFAILGLSALIAFFRGFVREVLSLGAWIGALVISLYSFPKVAEWLEPQLGSGGIANGLAGMVTFMGSLIGLSILNAFLVRFFKAGKDVGVVDNALGFVFGVARGLLLVSIGFYVMSFFFKESEYPEWIQSAQTRPYVEEVTGWIVKLAPDYLGDLEYKSQIEPKDDGPFTDLLDSLPTPQTNSIFDADDSKPDAPPASLPGQSNHNNDDDSWPKLEDLRHELGQ